MKPAFCRQPARSSTALKFEGDSPVQRADLKVGDVVTEINGRPVLSASDLRDRTGPMEADTNVAITYLRSGKQFMATISIAPATVVIHRERQH